MKKHIHSWLAALAVVVLLNFASEAWASPSSVIMQIGGGAAAYAILFEGAGGNTLQVTNVTINGNIGVGNNGLATDSGPSTINGSINFSAANTGQFSNNNGSNIITGGVNYSSSAVTMALNAAGSFNTTIGAESGTAININGSTTINASAGVLDANGNRVFTVMAFNTTNSDVLTINGDAAGDNVVFNFLGLSANFNNQVVLNGLSTDNVLYNFVGGANLTGGPTLQINDNASSFPSSAAQGIFLDPNGAISVVNANVNGRVIGGDTHNFQYVSGSKINAPISVPEPSSLILLGSGLVGLVGLCKRRFKTE